jgi:hypothetical protein
MQWSTRAKVYASSSDNRVMIIIDSVIPTVLALHVVLMMTALYVMRRRSRLGRRTPTF